MTEIFKIQRPVTGSLSMYMCLVYNQSRSIEFNTEFDDETLGLLFGNAYKVYFKGELISGEISFTQKVADQGW